MERRQYPIDKIVVNQKEITRVIIDSHYEIKHGNYIDDSLILALVAMLDNRNEIPEAISNEFEYFSTLLTHMKKQYRLVWLMENDSIFIGVVNAYRDDRSK